jgi:signal transduction histidine kinase
MVAENRGRAARCGPRYAVAVNGETATESRRKNSARRDLVVVVLCAAELESLDEARRLLVFRLVQEAMTNVARHFAATQVRIQIERVAALGGAVGVTSSRGAGFKVTAFVPLEEPQPAGAGARS